MSDVEITRSAPRMSCSICQRVTSPIHLSSCFHNFCPDCLQSRVTSSTGQYQCPLCQTVVNVSEMANRDYTIREDSSPNSNVQTIRLGGGSPRSTSPNVRVLDATSPTANVQTVRLDGSPRVTTHRYATDQAGNLVRVDPSAASGNLVNVIQTSPNTRSYVLTNQGLEPTARGDFSRTYVADDNPPKALPALPMDRTFTRSPSTGSKICDICQDGRKATSYCTQCDQHFCETCSKAHIKMKASRFHDLKLVTGSGFNTEMGARKQSSALSSGASVKEFCLRHGNQVTIFCKRCNMMICSLCQSQEHQGHAAKPIAEEASQVRKDLTISLQRQITLSERLKAQLNEAERRQDTYPQDLDQEMGKLNHQITEMQLELEREKNKAANELSNHYREHATRNAELLENSQKNYAALMEVKAEVLDLLNSNDDVYVATRGSQLQKKLENIERECRNKELPLSSGPTLQFYQGEIDPGKIRNMVGGVTSGAVRYENFPAQRTPSRPTRSRTASIQSLPSVGSNSVFNGPITATPVSPVKKFSIPFTDGVGYVYGIGPVDSDKAWVTLMGHTSVLLVSNTGIVLKSVRLAEITEDVTHDGNGGCYVTCPGNKCVKHVARDGIFTTLVDDLRQDPHGIACRLYMEGNTLKQEIYICFTESMGTRTSLFEKTNGSVHVLDNDGEDLGRGFHFQSPTRIDVNQESNMLCISDHSNGCVTVCDKTGQNVEALYTGVDHSGFKPLGVCFDDNGLVIIADWRNGQVIRIDRDGAHSEVLIQDVHGPQSVAFKNGFLWVGGNFGTVHVYNMAA